MAQKREKEETEFKVVPETITLCVNNCGFTGNPATNNMCQKCFNNTVTSSSSSSSSSSSGTGLLTTHKSISTSEASRSRSPRPVSKLPVVVSEIPSRDLKRPDRTLAGAESEVAKPAKREVNRCSGCRRKVGLTGFRCRCGELFCAEHRYSDRHDCTYDYKAAGREAIARENPVVKAAKIVKL